MADMPANVSPSRKLQKGKSVSVSVDKKDGTQYYQQGMKCLQLCQYRKSLPFFLKAESLLYPASYLKLYFIYRYGHGVSKEVARAERYFERLVQHNSWFVAEAAIGTSDAQYNMGCCYYEGIGGLDRDLNKAVYWFLLSAKQGSVFAKQTLGNCYRFGKGVEKDEKKAVCFYRQAAEQGYARAQWMLGLCCTAGVGVEGDRQEGASLYRLAADQGLSEGQLNLGLCYFLGRGAKEDKKEAVRLFWLAADQGYRMAQYILGYCYV